MGLLEHLQCSMVFDTALVQPRWMKVWVRWGDKNRSLWMVVCQRLAVTRNTVFCSIGKDKHVWCIEGGCNQIWIVQSTSLCHPCLQCQSSVLSERTGPGWWGRRSRTGCYWCWRPSDPVSIVNILERTSVIVCM